MRFTELELKGAFAIEPERLEDERGFFARTYCVEEFERFQLRGRVVQCNVSYNRERGTLRGMHYQAHPHAEAKLVSCVQGEIHDVLVDLRDGSPTNRRWTAVTLSAENGRAVYVPEGFAHGFLTMVPDSTVFYQMFTSFHPESARGVRWDDPSIGIQWPNRPSVVSPRDLAYESLS